jgi:hypothetical protein
MAKEVIVTAKRVKNRKRLSKVVRISLLILLVFLILLYIVLEIIYNEGRFTVILDSNRTLESGLAVFDSLNNGHGKRKLEATPIRFMDNISYKWIPENVDTEADGSHNGQNYIAYSFYVENQGNEVLNYHYEVIVDDVIKNVDNAIRIRIYRNGEDTTYAKRSFLGNEPEKDTVPFKDIKNAEGTIILEKVTDFKPDDLDRYTVLIWLEGDDPDCTDALIGGEIKMHMVITEEHIEKGRSEN